MLSSYMVLNPLFLLIRETHILTNLIVPPLKQESPNSYDYELKQLSMYFSLYMCVYTHTYF
jgi:hypothetical protein